MKHLYLIIFILSFFIFHQSAFSNTENDDSGNTIAIYPNPAKTYCYLSYGNKTSSRNNVFDKDVTVKIYNVLGKEVNLKIEEAEGEKKMINLSEQAEGIYFIKVTFSNKNKANQRSKNTIVKKLIIKR